MSVFGNNFTAKGLVRRLGLPTMEGSTMSDGPNADLTPAFLALVLIGSIVLISALVLLVA